MRARYDQLGKRIVRRALSPFGAVRVEHEIPVADAQAGDAYFVPRPGNEAERTALGWLDPMTREPCLLEMFQRTPGAIEVRGTVRKQLTLDHVVALEAAAQKQARPPLPQLWLITTGHPADIVAGYGLEATAAWPPGIWVSPHLLALGLVVLSELPRRRDTLLLRLLGRGAVLEQAIEDLKALPKDAKEREVAYQPLVALRFKVEQNPSPDQEARAFLMATQDIYEEWEQRVVSRAEAVGEARGEAIGETRGEARGEARGLMKSLVGTYELRFGTMPAALRKALAKKVDAESIGRWTILFATAPAAEIAATIRKSEPGR